MAHLFNPEARAHIVGAARYFVSSMDARPDEDSCTGLDDDVEVFNHVARLRRSRHRPGRRAVALEDPAQTVTERWSNLLREAESVAVPAAFSEFEPLLGAALQGLGPHVPKIGASIDGEWISTREPPSAAMEGSE